MLNATHDRSNTRCYNLAYWNEKHYKKTTDFYAMLKGYKSTLLEILVSI
jgi:hypothetical protein